MPGDDLTRQNNGTTATTNNTLPSLAQIMPPRNQQQQQQQPQDGSAASAAAVIGNGYYPQQQSYVQDAYSQVSTSQTTPSVSYTDPNTTITGKPKTDSSTRSSVSSSANNNTSPTDANGAPQCICKAKGNKIPRPRNAFILFRQKYHQAILDEGSVIRSNPEVSRELGRRWRALPAAEKEHWNKLAEDEKKNHALKYPNYKYEPKRNGKNKNCLVCKDKPTAKQLAKQQQQQQQQQQATAAVQSQRHHSEAALAAAAAQQQMLQHQQQIQQQAQQQQQQAAQQQVQATQAVQQQQHDQYQNYFKQQQLNNLQGYPSYIISNTNPYLQNSSTSLASSSSTGNLPLPGAATNSVGAPSTAASSMGFYDQEKLSPLSATTYTNNNNSTSGIANVHAAGMPFSLPQQQQQQQAQLHHPGVVGGVPIGVAEYQLQGAHPQQHQQQQSHAQGYGLDAFHQQ